MYWLLLSVSPVNVICFSIKYRIKSGNFGHQVNSAATVFYSYFDYWNKTLN